jgi:hypothetical protein
VVALHKEDVAGAEVKCVRAPSQADSRLEETVAGPGSNMHRLVSGKRLFHSRHIDL